MKKLNLIIPLISPDSNYLMIWDIIHSLIIIASIVIFPLEVAENISFIELYYNETIPLYIFSYLVLSVDLLLHLNIGYYEKGVCIMNRN